jgi:hypothetical protein
MAMGVLGEWGTNLRLVLYLAVYRVCSIFLEVWALVGFLKAVCRF